MELIEDVELIKINMKMETLEISNSYCKNLIRIWHVLWFEGILYLSNIFQKIYISIG